MFFSYGSSQSLGTQPWETPVGKVIEGMENVRNFYSYGDMPPWGEGPVQGKIYSGRSYIEENFPLTAKFLTCTVERGGSEAATDRELLESVDTEWNVRPMVKKAENKVQHFLKSNPLRKASIGGTDELGMLVIVGVVVMASLLLAKLRMKRSAGKDN